MDSQSLQQALRDLDSAYQHFFRRVKRGERHKGFPRFKSRRPTRHAFASRSG
jgi:putative transposase